MHILQECYKRTFQKKLFAVCLFFGLGAISHTILASECITINNISGGCATGSGSITFTASGSAVPTNYDWAIGNGTEGFGGIGINGRQVIVNLPVSDTYHLIIQNSACATVYFAIPDATVIAGTEDLTDPDPLCACNGSVTLYYSDPNFTVNNADYTLTSSVTGYNESVTGSMATSAPFSDLCGDGNTNSYTWTVTANGTNCSVTQTGTFGLPGSSFTVSISPTVPVICPDGSLTLTAVTNPSTGNYSYLWLKNGSSTGITSKTYKVTEPSQSDTYSVQVTLNGCTMNSTPVSVSTIILSSLNIAADCDGNITITGVTETPDGTPLADIKVTANEVGGSLTQTVTSNSSGVFTIAFSGVPNGAYTFNVFSYDANGNACAATQITTTACATNVAVTQVCSHKISCDGIACIKVTVRNDSDVSVDSVKVLEKLPCCFTFIKGTPAPWTFTTSENVVTATYTKPLAPGKEATFMINLQANCCCPRKKTARVRSTVVNSISPQSSASCTIEIG